MKSIKRFEKRGCIVEYYGMGKLEAMSEFEYYSCKLNDSQYFFSWKSNPRKLKQQYFEILLFKLF